MFQESTTKVIHCCNCGSLRECKPIYENGTGPYCSVQCVNEDNDEKGPSKEELKYLFGEEHDY